MTFRTVVREVALGQGIWASFMPKPFTAHPGSGMHTHVSLFEGDRNAFFEAGAEYQLSKVGRQFIAGVLTHAAEISCVTNQWVNSYKRLLGGGEAPSYICWGHNNRSAMIRVPMYKPNKGPSTRIELRTLDAACNPYLAFAVILAAGMKGIDEGYDLPRRGRGRRLVAHRARAQGPRHRAAAEEPVRRDRHRRELRAARRDPRRARLRLLPAQQAPRVGGVPGPGLRVRAGPDAAGPVRPAPTREELRPTAAVVALTVAVALGLLVWTAATTYAAFHDDDCEGPCHEVVILRLLAPVGVLLASGLLAVAVGGLVAVLRRSPAAGTDPDGRRAGVRRVRGAGRGSRAVGWRCVTLVVGLGNVWLGQRDIMKDWA